MRKLHTLAFTATKGVPPSVDTFATLFAETPFARAGTHHGKRIKAKVVAVGPKSVKLDIGTKFPSYIPKPPHSDRLKEKDEIIVTLRTTDYVKQVMGDPKPISLSDGDVVFHSYIAPKKPKQLNQGLTKAEGVELRMMDRIREMERLGTLINSVPNKHSNADVPTSKKS